MNFTTQPVPGVMLYIFKIFKLEVRGSLEEDGTPLELLETC